MAAEPANESSDFDSSSSSSAAEVDATSTDDENDPSICSLCHATDRVTTQIADCDELKSITEYIESSSKAVKKVKYACQTCLYKLYTIIDQNRLKAFKAEREQRLAAVAALIESTGAPSPSTVIETPASDSSPEPSPSPQLPPSSLQPGTSSNEPLEVEPEVEHNETETVNNVELENVQVTNTAKRTNSVQNTDVSSIPSSPSHLDVLYEQSESAVMTESGGTLDQYKTANIHCRYCPKNFVHMKRFKKHMRTHQNKLRSSVRSGSTSRGRNTPNIVYACNDCSATFDSNAKLKTHCRIHLKRYYCSYCQKENFSLHDHNFHEAECKGVQMAREEFVETRRITRSVARSMRSNKTLKSDTTWKTTRASRNDKTLKSEKTGRSLRSKKDTPVETVAVKVDANDDEDEEDCASSVAYTDYTAVNSYVRDWVMDTCRSEVSSSDYMEGLPEREKEMLQIEKVIAEAETKVYTCFVSHCKYSTNNLREMCLHEVVNHSYKVYYYCRKCLRLFTSKPYLNYHFYVQTRANYRCNKCSMSFNYEFELRYHFLEHEQYQEHPCLFCGNKFISAQDLRIHCLETQHDPKKKKELICIDHSMTIVNKTPPEPPPPKRTFTSRTIDMKLPKIPSLRPMSPVFIDGKQLLLGSLDFVMPFNCVAMR